MITNETNTNNKNQPREKILLLILPYWIPVVPPSGMSNLKSFLKKHGYNVRSIDANIAIIAITTNSSIKVNFF